MIRASTVAAAVTAASLAPGVARADDARPGEPMRRTIVDVAGGVRGGDGTVLDVRGFAGGVVLRTRASARPGADGSAFVAIGLHGAYGAVTVEDPRAVHGMISPRRTAWGPEARLGYGWMDDGLEAYVWAGGGPVLVAAEPISDQLPERGDHVGARAAVGVAWPGSFRAALDDDDDDDCDLGSSSGLCGLGPILRLLAPNTIEVSWEHVAGVDRAGVGLGYAF